MLGCGNSSRYIREHSSRCYEACSRETAKYEASILTLPIDISTIALSKDMYDDGYHNIVNIDFSKTVIENMAEKCKDCVGMECKHALSFDAKVESKHW